MEIKVSIIIPVYNAEQYITPCIESLLNQTLYDCEFIFINDGSSDQSQQIIEFYQKRDERIKLFNQQNQGVSLARNQGLRQALGEYVGFVDADDYVEKDMFETLYATAKNSDSDVIISNFESEMDGRTFITQYPFPIHTLLMRDYIEKEILPYFLKLDNLNTACNKIYRNRIIKENQIEFPKKIALGEDSMFNMRFFSHAYSMKYINYTGYHYREVAGSATRNIAGKDYFKRALEVYKMDLPQAYLGRLDQTKVQQLKAIKLVQSVLSYIHIYFTPSREVHFSEQYSYVKKMIRNPFVQDSLPLYYEEKNKSLGRYEHFLLKMIKQKSALGLYCAASYSRWRNS